MTTRLGSGAILVLLGMAIIGLIDNFVVEIAKDAGLWQFHFSRALMAVPLLVLIGVATGQAVVPKRIWAVGLRSFFLATSMLLYFGSIPAMPIALVVAGLFTSPVFVLIFSRVLLGVTVGPMRIAAVLIGFLGVLLIIDPFGVDFSGAVILPVIGGALYALNALAARRLCADESTVAMLVGFFAMLGVFGGIGLLVFHGRESAEFVSRGWVAPSSGFLFWTFVQAVGSIIAVGFLTRAYQTSETTVLVVFEYSLLIFASLWGYALYGQVVSMQAAFGMGLIVVSGTIIALRNPVK